MINFVSVHGECNSSILSTNNNYYQNQCFKLDGPESGNVRLSYGSVEVFLSRRWVPVADSNMSWTQENARVVCRELGYFPNGM